MPTRHGLPPAHLLLAVAIMAVWGTNFVVIKYALEHLPPLTLALLRFTLAFFPLAFFLPRPKVGWGNLAAYGVLIGAGQFGILFTAMRADITPGLASLIGVHTDGSATPLGLGLVLLAAFSWSSGNMVSRQAAPQNMLSYVVWSSIFAVPPLLIFALLLEGPEAMMAGIKAADGATWAAVLWQSVGNTMFGYAAWGWLLNRHPAAIVAPMALMVPVFGMGASALLLGEPLQSWKLTAFALVMAGLSVGMLWPRIKQGIGK